MPLTRFRRAPLILNPAVLTLTTWAMVGSLYALHFSNILLFSAFEMLKLIGLIVLPMLLASFCFWLAYKSQQLIPLKRTVVVPQPDLSVIDHRVRQCIRLWVGCEIVETIVSGGVPLQWIATGSSKVNFDYGIPSVHGLVDALLLALATVCFALYMFTQKRSYLVFPAVAVVWSLVLVSRGTLIVLVVQSIVVYLRFQRIRWASFVRIAVLMFALLVLFGIIGDFRSGAEAFRTLAQPSETFPDWAPSGMLWAYIYITTPINNLLYSTQVLRPLYNILLPNTASTLLPSVLRNIVYGVDGAQAAVSGGLVVEALNVSTAYVGPYQDMGGWGIVGYSAILAISCEVYWRRNGFRNVLIFAVFAQTLMLSLFFNLLFSLPILGQLAWFWYFTPQPKATSPSLNARLEEDYA